jgi:hypothetical protein
MKRSKALGSRFHVVAAGRDQRKNILTVRVCYDFSLGVGGLIGEADLRAGDGSALQVGNSASERAGIGLRKERKKQYRASGEQKE